MAIEVVATCSTNRQVLKSCALGRSQLRKHIQQLQNISVDLIEAGI